jgi:hypothetical protein
VGHRLVWSYIVIASGTAHRIALFIGGGTIGISSVNLGIYADSDGVASVLLSEATVTTIQLDKWNIVSLPALQIAKGTKYWIAVDPVGPEDMGIFVRENGAVQIAYEYATKGVSSLPTNWLVGPSFIEGAVSAYVAE